MPKPLDFSATNAFNTSERRQKKKRLTRVSSLLIQQRTSQTRNLFSEFKKEYEVTPTQSTMHEDEKDNLLLLSTFNEVK